MLRNLIFFFSLEADCFKMLLFVIGLINTALLQITFVCSAVVINCCSILTQTSFI